jgi:hypothetical protein
MKAFPLLCTLTGIITFGAAGAAAQIGDLPSHMRPGEFGVAERAAAGGRIIVLAVQRGISALPLASAQFFSYEFDPDLDAVVREKRMGPVAFRGTDTIGGGRFSVRVSTSYFEIEESLGPIDYLVELPGTDALSRFGLDVQARVGIVNLAASYGISRRIELTANLPIVVTDTELTEVSASNERIINDVKGLFPVTEPWERMNPVNPIDKGLAEGPIPIVIKRDSFDALGEDVSTGTGAGVGRIALGAKISVLNRGATEIAFLSELLLPSPNEDEYAGSASAAILPRLVGSIALAPYARLHLDLGYEWDFDSSELRRFAWAAGMSFPVAPVLTIDGGFSGSEYQEGIAWTPRRATYGTRPMTALGNNELGTTYADLLLGLKLALAERIFVGGVVSVPVVSNEGSPDVTGTLAIEFVR